jgi:hypothetical protein
VSSSQGPQKVPAYEFKLSKAIENLKKNRYVFITVKKFKNRKRRYNWNQI